MNAINLYRNYSASCSTHLTRVYSSSFFMGIRLFSKPYREPICAVYGFVRLADEIVDSFHDQDKQVLLAEFRRETRSALERKFSLNPILHAFQEVVHDYRIPEDLIEAFLTSMEMDLELERCDEELFNQYV
ncbi:MAG TPA: squalene/phytoene synthase family protein, partial [Saprospiraceae bacterium]|nr:squalene/phytoene synthase family protein [Saprospiraceae bacterium]